MDAQSYIEMPSAKVRALCVASIQRVEAEREKRRRHLIDGALSEDAASWWRRLWKLPPRTEQEVIETWENGRLGDVGYWRWDHANDFGAKQQTIASRLLVASKHADTVFVSAADLYWIT